MDATAPQEAGMYVNDGSGDFQAQAFNCWGRTDNPHLAKHFNHNRVAAEVTTWCATNLNYLYTTSTLERLRFWGWQELDTATKGPRREKDGVQKYGRIMTA
jgi:hypothetical protein